MNIKRTLKASVVIAALALFLVWAAAIIKCEYFTFRYGDQFKYLYIGHTMFQTPDYLKVIDYTDTTAEVYYVTPRSGGDVVYYKRDNSNSEWKFVEWETIWSASGSAEDFIWPYGR